MHTKFEYGHTKCAIAIIFKTNIHTYTIDSRLICCMNKTCLIENSFENISSVFGHKCKCTKNNKYINYQFIWIQLSKLD